jgi:hypothetical protein
MRARPSVALRRLTSTDFSGFSIATPHKGAKLFGTNVIMAFVGTTKTKTTMTTATKVAG